MFTPVFPGSVSDPNRYQLRGKSEYFPAVAALQTLLKPAVGIAIDEYIAAATFAGF
jgi:hypothetical protein